MERIFEWEEVRVPGVGLVGLVLWEIICTPEPKLEKVPLGGVLCTCSGQYLGFLPRKTTFPEEDPALLLGRHPTKYEAIGDVVGKLDLAMTWESAA